MRKALVCVWMVACLLVGIAIGLESRHQARYTQGAIDVAECVRDGGSGWYILDSDLRCIYD